MRNDALQTFDTMGALGGLRGHNPPEDGVFQHFQRVISLYIGDTEQYAVGP